MKGKPCPASTAIVSFLIRLSVVAMHRVRPYFIFIDRLVFSVIKVNWYLYTCRGEQKIKKKTRRDKEGVTREPSPLRAVGDPEMNSRMPGFTHA